MYFVDYMFLGFAFISLYLVALFMILFAKNHKEMFDEPEAEDPPSISLVIPAHNEEKHIAETIRAVKALSYPPHLLEVLVVDDGSSDRTAELAKQEGVRVIEKKNAGKASALNLGMAQAKGDVVGCVDADSYPEPDALLKMVPFFSDERVAAVTSSIFVMGAKNFLERLQEMEYILIAWNRKLLDYLNSVYVTPGPLSLYRKEVIEEVGGFDSSVLTEDIEIAWRLQEKGYKIRMALSAKVYTHVPSSFRAWWRQRLRWDIGGIQTAGIYRRHCFRRSQGIFGLFIIPYFVLSMAVSMVGLTLFSYLMAQRASDFAEFWYYAGLVGIDPLKYFPFDLLPNVFTILGVLIFILSIVYLVTGLKSMQREVLNKKTFFDMLLYLSVYLFTFPILLLQSFWRIAVYKKQKW